MNIHELAEKTVKELHPYGLELVYIDYEDRLSDEQLALLARGDVEGFHYDLMDQTIDAENEATMFYVNEALNHIESQHGLDLSHNDDMIEALQEAVWSQNTQDLPMELARMTMDRINFMVPVIDEDNANFGAERSPEELIDALKLEQTKENKEFANTLISESYSDLGMCWLVFDLSALQAYDLALGLQRGDTAKFEILSPVVCYGNPFTGAYSAEQLYGVTRTYSSGEVMLDGSWGYGLNQTYGDASDLGTCVELIISD